MPGCGCGGGAAAPKALTVKTDGRTASVVQQAAAPPGMPRYKVLGSDAGDRTFDTYNDARLFRHEHGGKLRAI